MFEHELLAGLAHPAFDARGAHDGPTLCLLGGIHGCEYSSIAAVTRVHERARRDAARRTDRRGAGCQHAVVRASLARSSFRKTARTSTGAFPARSTVRYTDVLARSIFDELIAPSDFLSTSMAAIRPKGWSRSRSMSTPRSASEPTRSLSRSGCPTSCASRRKRGTLGGTTAAAAADAGIPAVIAEAGGRGQLEEDAVALLVAGVRNALRRLEMLPGDPAAAEADMRLVQTFAWLRCAQAGWWDAAVSSGDEVAEGRLVGRIRDLWGDVLEELHAPCDGVVLFITTSPAVAADGLLLGLGADLAPV